MLDDPNQDEDLISPDNRRPVGILDSRRQADGELSDSDDEGMGGRRNEADYSSKRTRGSSPTLPNGNAGAPGRSGIMMTAPGHAPGGPSSHTTAERILASGIRVEPEDVPMVAEDVAVPSAPSATNGTEETPMETN